MAYIGSEPNTIFRVAPVKDTFTGDGSTTTFDLANLVPAGGENALQVFIDNVRQEPGSGKAYTLGNDGSGDLKRITFSAAPANSSAIYVLTNFDNEAFINTDINGQELFLDADGDTSISADTDDQIDIKIAGADDFSFTANTFTAKTGSSIVVPEGGLTLGSTAVTSTAAELNALDGIGSTVSELNLLDGSAKSTSSITIADTDAFIVIDGTTTKQIPASDIKTYNPGFTVSTITGATELAEQPAGTDEIVLSDAGTLKRLDFSHLFATPAFEATRSASYNISDATAYKVAFDTEVFDTDGKFDHSSNYRFTPTVAGKYFCYLSVQQSGESNQDFEQGYAYIYKNGSSHAQVHTSSYDGDAIRDITLYVHAVIDLDADDYIEAYAFYDDNDLGSNPRLVGGNQGTRFGAFRLLT